MSLTTRQRTSIFQKLVPLLGEEDADALMAEFPAAEHDVLVTREHLRAEMALLGSNLSDALRAELAGLATKAELVGLATKADLEGLEATIRAEMAGLATKAELVGLATKADLEGLEATIRAEMAGLATKAELVGLATKEDLVGLATKAELQAFATRAELRAELSELRTEVHAHINRAMGATTGVLLAAMGLLAALT
jgi:hypothetical protein